MKKLLIVSIGIICAGSLSAQNTDQKEIHYPDGSLYKECYWVKETKPLRDIIAERHAKGLDKPKVKFGPNDAPSAEELAKKHHPGSPNPEPDGALQTQQGPHRAAATLQNFEGQGGLGSYPQDPNGMIGSNYYVQTINSTIAAWTKTGGVYIPQTDLYALFGSLGSCDCGDPVTVYDKMADRWIISEFEGGITNSNIDTLLFAVSKTNDPAGAYYLYAFAPYINSFDDYPKYNVWGNGYYMTCNCSNPDMVVAFERDSMLIGSPRAAFVAMPWNYGPGLNGCEGNFFCPMMLDCDGTLPPANAPEFLFYYWDNSWGCLPASDDSICIEEITVNWVTKKGTINANYQHLVTAAFNSNFSNVEAFDNIVPQPGNNVSNLLASTDGYFGYRIPYLRWSSYNSCVMQFPVNTGTLAAPTASIRWFELHQDTTTKLWSIYQQSTYGPADGLSRWEAGIAMDNNGDIGMEYSVSGPDSVYPSLRYTGRKYCDPLNTMTLAEGTAAKGNTIVNTPQNPGNRWGDYSHLSVDPSDGITFWGTNMYAENGAGSGIQAGTRIFSFQVPSCLILDVDNVTPTNEALTAYQDGNTLNVKGSNLPVGQRVVVELFDVNGKTLAQKAMVTSGATLETSFNVSSLAKAIYIVRVGNDSFQRVAKLNIK